MNYMVSKLFPTLLYLTKLDDKFCEIAERLKEEKIRDMPEWASKKNGLATENKYILNEDRYEELRKEILRHTLNFSNKVLCHKVSNVLMGQSWLSIKRPGDSHQLHKHTHSYISGTFYWDDGITPVLFYNNDDEYPVFPEQELYEHEGVEDVFRVRRVAIEKGMLVLFQGHVRHSVPVNETKENRYSLAFNTWPEEVGEYHAMTHLDMNKLKK